MMEVDKSLQTEEPPVDSLTTRLPESNPLLTEARPVKSPTKRKLPHLAASVMNRLTLALLAFSSIFLDSPPALSQKVNNNSSGSAENTLINPDTQTIEKASDQAEDSGVGQDYTRTYIDPLGNRIEWSAFNGTRGTPPNNPDHYIDKIFVSVNNSPKVAFQENETQFPSDTSQITVEGHWMNTKLNIAYVANTIARNSTGGMSLPVIAILLDAKNVTNSAVVDTSKQILVLDLLQNAGLGDRFEYFKVGTDSKGEFLNFRIKNSVNPKDDGDYMIRLDNNGLPVGGAVKIESVTMTRRQFLPFVATGFSGK